MSGASLEVYGPEYNAAMHSWPKGVKPTGPQCPVCKGAGEVFRGKADVPGPKWEPTEPEVHSCFDCFGTGIRVPREMSRRA